ncbi:hypothetical protein FQZ97_552290 [compost metagenome]
MAACDAATALIAICSRSQGSCSIRQTKPRLTSPSSASAGRRTSLKNSSDVSCAFRPSFFRRLPFSKPGMPRSTRNRLVPFAPAAGSVLATTITRSACQPLVMKVLLPLSR